MIRRFLGLRGSWKWACRKMMRGHIVRCKHFTGTVIHKIDSQENKRIVWAFPKRDDRFGERERWENAIIFLTDFNHTDWEVVE